MTDRIEALEKWQRRLEATFKGPSGIVGERVQSLFGGEQAHSLGIAEKTTGFTVLMNSFMDFAIMTMDEASSHGHTINVYDFAFNTTAVQRLRAALRLFYDGYYYDAASLIRSVFEVSLYLSAVLHGHFWFDELFCPKEDIDYGVTPPKTILKIHRRHRDGVASLVRQKMRGQDSGLSAQECDDIDDLFSIQHHHVHYGYSTVNEFVQQMLVTRTLPSVLPVLDMRRASIFCNPTVCVAWTLLRVLPWLSLPNRYSGQWRQWYQVLDESFDFYVRGWEKPIGPAFLNLMRLQFSFDPAKASEQVLKTESHGTTSAH